MFEKFENRYIIEGNLTAVTALHIGAAEDEFRPNGCRNPFFRNAAGLPLIPGSSLKGAMRSFLEQYLSSEAGRDALLKDVPFRKDICNEQNPCADAKRDSKLKELLKEKGDNSEETISDYLFGTKDGGSGKLCMVCRLFGSHCSAAKFSIRDARIISGTFEDEFEIRSGVTIDRNLGTSVENKTFTTEVVPEGTEFSFKAVLENGDPCEWHVVEQLLRAMEIGLIQIGGMKSRGLGEIKLTNIRYQKIDETNIAAYLSGESVPFIDFHDKGEEERRVCSEN